jgi:uncharacterized protein
MKIILPGASGQLGQLLVRELARVGHTCIVLTRSPATAARTFAILAHEKRVRLVVWDAATLGSWARELDDADAVINLAGRSVDCRYTARNLAAMRASRVNSTRVIGDAIAAAARPPAIWLQASTATIYAHTYGPPHDETSGVIGGNEPDAPAYWRNSVDIGTAWEEALFAAPTPATRRVALRSAMVMGAAQGGVFSAFATLTRFGLGHHGHGRQFVSWIHEHDFIAAVKFLLTRPDLAGAINLSAPEPLPNAAFVTAIRTALGGPRLAIPAPAWMLEIGAFIRRTDTELLLKSRRVIPGRLLAAGFRFEFPEWSAAARDLVSRWRGKSTAPELTGSPV